MIIRWQIERSVAEDEKGLIVCHKVTDIGFIFIGITVLAPTYSRTLDVSDRSQT
jgi:ribosomal protein L18E